MRPSDCVILLDPGHGVDVAGKCSPDKSLREYKWAREMERILAEKFKKLGMRVYDTTQGSEYEPGLSVRATRANTIAKTFKGKTSLFISIHCNAAPPSDGQWHSARGWAIYTSKGKTKSDTLATCIYNEAVETFKDMKIRKDMSDGDPDLESNFYVLVHTTMPAVLVENFFQDNKDDVAFLLSDEGKQKCAEVMYNGVLKYLGI